MKQVLESTLKNIFGRVGLSIAWKETAERNAFPKAIDMQQRLIAGLTDKPVILDVGAHEGRVSLEYLKTFPGASIYALEPAPEAFGLLQQNTATQPQIKSFQLGLSDKSGSEKFYVNDFDMTSSLFLTSLTDDKVWEKQLYHTRQEIKADFLTLDDFLQQQKLESIDLMKLDVQGAEHLVLEGGRTAISQGKIKYLFMEVMTIESYQGQLPWYKLLEKCYDLGFTLFSFYEASYTDEGQIRQMDALLQYSR